MIVWECDKTQLKPEFLTDVEKLLDESPFEWHAISGHRSIEEQTKLYNAWLKDKKVKAAPPGQSAHNWRMAIDVELYIRSGRWWKKEWDTNHPGWQWLKKNCLPHPRLTHGSKFGDWPHIQRYNWPKFK